MAIGLDTEINVGLISTTVVGSTPILQKIVSKRLYTEKEA